jgi:hypothetical protein
MGFIDDARRRWFVLAGLWVALLVVGISGFVQQASADGVDRPFADTLYLTLQLATLDYDGSSGPMNWRLQVARFVAPVMAAGTVLQTASVVFREQFQRWRLRYAKDHTIVCGLGDTGSRIARGFARAGERVVAIELDPLVIAGSDATEELDVVLAGSASDPALLRTAGVERARRIVLACGSDADNVQATAVVAQLSADRTGTALRCAVRLTDAELTVLLRAADLESHGGTRIRYFNLHESAARALLSEHAPPMAAEGAPPHLMVMGLGQFGRSLVLALCQQWADLHPGEKLCPTLVDRSARGRWEALRLQHPALDDVCEPTLVDLDVEDPSADAVDGFIALLTEDPPSWVAVAFDDESFALANAVFLHQHLPWGEVPIIVRMRTEDGLGGLLAPHPDSEVAFPGVELFPFLDRTCTPATVDGGVREQLARAVHDDYLAHLPPAGERTSLQRPWDELADDQREASRRRVDGILADLAAVGCDLVPLRRWGAPQVTLDDTQVGVLAEREHGRWFAERTADGWTHGPVRDDEAKRNPLLVPWEELGEEARRSNLASAANLLPMLARNGFEAARRSGRADDPA